MQMTEIYSLSVRQLKNKKFQRLPINTRNKLINKEELSVASKAL